VNPINVTEDYLKAAEDNTTLLRAVEKQFILGSTYSFTYNSLLGNTPANGFYFNGVLDLSGNIAGLITKANVKKGDTIRIAGAPFSQYTKVDLDFRWYRRVGAGKTIWANRIITGIGIPYGNSSQLPYIKQFFSGGNNSVRAFRSRSIGPGTFFEPDPVTFFDQSGDIRLELNSELRVPLSGIIHGAVFVDAGNIWLFNEDTTKPGGKFSGGFLNQLAVGAGVGLRFDFNFLVLRLDLATPLRKPWLQDKRWVFNQFNLKNRDWRRENLVFNLAIGYPF
jgi:outer membrane protein assembly factor BamA